MDVLMNEDHHRVSDEELKEISVLVRETHATTEKLLEAFPGGDIRAHREYHEGLIKAARAQENFWNDLKLDLAKKGLWAIILIVAGLLVVGVSAKIGLPR
jgi:hypothetical protein